jgi:hypothetical protein
VDNPHIRLLFYALAVSGACVEIFGSIEAGVWHPSLYWAAVGGIIPCGLFGILCISQSYAGSACECQPRDPAKPMAANGVLALSPAAIPDSLRFGSSAPPIIVERRRVTPARPLIPSEGIARARCERVVERCS